MTKLNLKEYKQRLNKYCEFPEYLFNLTDKCKTKFPIETTNELIHYGVLIWFLSKFIEDKVLGVKYYAKVAGIKYYDLLIYEDCLFMYYLKNALELNKLIFQNYLNPPTLTACGIPPPPLETNVLEGGGIPETLRSGPPGLENPGCDAISDSRLSTCA